MSGEQRWATTDLPDAVLYDVERAQKRLLTNRKTRLFGCGCYRLVWDKFSMEHIRTIVELAESRADRLVKHSEINNTRLVGGGNRPAPDGLLHYYAYSLFRSRVIPGHIARQVRRAVNPEKYREQDRWPPCQEQATLARDVFGNPFRPVTFEPTWRTSTVLALARQMYESRDFSAMPILADALQDAGCESTEVLEHCRDPKGIHVRGCWLVDRLLAKG